ncbi:unnamed protein product [Amoebophrya sp. A120]|nr:unnamed protein product [Amoebophrya sp. A120]|eukprot:GSA120T00018219001.1
MGNVYGSTTGYASSYFGQHLPGGQRVSNNSRTEGSLAQGSFLPDWHSLFALIFPGKTDVGVFGATHVNRYALSQRPVKICGNEAVLHAGRHAADVLELMPRERKELLEQEVLIQQWKREERERSRAAASTSAAEKAVVHPGTNVTEVNLNTGSSNKEGDTQSQQPFVLDLVPRAEDGANSPGGESRSAATSTSAGGASSSSSSSSSASASATGTGEIRNANRESRTLAERNGGSASSLPEAREQEDDEQGQQGGHPPAPPSPSPTSRPRGACLVVGSRRRKASTTSNASSGSASTASNGAAGATTSSTSGSYPPEDGAPGSKSSSSLVEPSTAKSSSSSSTTSEVAPKTTISSNRIVPLGFACLKGRKPDPNQDNFFGVTYDEGRQFLLGVFDGHGPQGQVFSEIGTLWAPLVLQREQHHQEALRKATCGEGYSGTESAFFDGGAASTTDSSSVAEQINQESAPLSRTSSSSSASSRSEDHYSEIMRSAFHKLTRVATQRLEDSKGESNALCMSGTTCVIVHGQIHLGSSTCRSTTSGILNRPLEQENAGLDRGIAGEQNTRASTSSSSSGTTHVQDTADGVKNTVGEPAALPATTSVVVSSSICDHAPALVDEQVEMDVDRPGTTAVTLPGYTVSQDSHSATRDFSGDSGAEACDRERSSSHASSSCSPSAASAGKKVVELDVDQEKQVRSQLPHGSSTSTSSSSSTEGGAFSNGAGADSSLELALNCGWLGDSRALVIEGRQTPPTRSIVLEKVTALTRDHKPEDEEADRLQSQWAAGTTKNTGFIKKQRVWFTCDSTQPGFISGLNMSRSLGDRYAHDVGVSSEPEVTSETISLLEPRPAANSSSSGSSAAAKEQLRSGTSSASSADAAGVQSESLSCGAGGGEDDAGPTGGYGAPMSSSLSGSFRRAAPTGQLHQARPQEVLDSTAYSSPKHVFVLLATDGVFEVLTNEQVAELLLTNLNLGKSLQQTAENIARSAADLWNQGTYIDDITVLLYLV